MQAMTQSADGSAIVVTKGLGESVVVSGELGRQRVED